MLAEKIVDCHNTHGESILWNHEDRKLWWSDIEGKKLWWLDPRDKTYGYQLLDQRLCAFAFREKGGMILAFDTAVVLQDRTGHQQQVARFEPLNSETRLNDACTDAEGRFIVGGMNEQSGNADSSVIRVNADLTVETLLTRVSCSNALALSPDNQWLYFADTPQGTVRRYEYASLTKADPEPGTVYPAEVVGGLPDGACVDSEGGLWIALWGGSAVVRINAKGEQTHKITLPVAYPTCCAFGGADLKTLFITTSRIGTSTPLEADGSLFSVATPFQGTLSPFFRG